MKAYAVLGSDDHVVGIWRDRETAEKVMARSAWARGERIVEMVSADRIAKLEAECAALKADAERYRHLRIGKAKFGGFFGREDALDAAIDAAIDAAKGE